MTDLQAMYAAHRHRGRGHHAALHALARQIGVDPDTIKRVLKRAAKEDDERRRAA